MTIEPTMIELRTDRLHVQIAEPGTLYRGSRFDWTSFITQVTLDEEHTFCTPESLVAGEGTGGIGLCSEFNISRPIGYDQAQPGQKFPKLGVGLLTRPDTCTYAFDIPYTICPFPIQTAVASDRVHFVVHPIPCQGVAARFGKDDLCGEQCRAYLFLSDEYWHRVLYDRRVRPQLSGDQWAWYWTGQPADGARRPVAGPAIRGNGTTGFMQYGHGHIRWPVTPQATFYARFMAEDLLRPGNLLMCQVRSECGRPRTFPGRSSRFMARRTASTLKFLFIFILHRESPRPGPVSISPSHRLHIMDPEHR